MLLRSANTYVILTILVLTAGGCRKNTYPTDYRGRVIELGSGGGFAGTETRYQLLEDGRLFTSSSRDTLPKQLAREKTRLANRWFVAYDSLHLEGVTFSKPGNTYRYIKDGDHRIVWSSTDMPDARINAFYQDFMQYWIRKAGKQ